MPTVQYKLMSSSLKFFEPGNSNLHQVSHGTWDVINETVRPLSMVGRKENDLLENL